MKLFFLLLCNLFYQTGIANKLYTPIDTALLVRRCSDFAITGKGDNAEWEKAKWTALTKINKGGNEYKTKFKNKKASRFYRDAFLLLVCF